MFIKMFYYNVIEVLVYVSMDVLCLDVEYVLFLR